jgi:hypothetical protein
MLEGFRKLLEAREQRFPALTAVLQECAPKNGEGAALDFGVERILDGVEAFVSKRESKRRR